ncbi:MAG TPA: CRISPR-associated endonuclease Cas3'' [Solirubrobacterales bacterium]|nr:CRISPR-associated endonuclease Cas3'' [Solirubrobacterales bacterium]
MATQAPAATAISFAEFARLVHAPEDEGWQPYPWQQLFAERCAAAGGAPPSWVIAPTGSGKTMAVDALVWALAVQADLTPAERTASTRIVWAIDRRILVDQVHEHAEALAGRLDRALDDGPENSLHGIAIRLLRLAAGEDVDRIGAEERRERGLHPLVATRWRGGIPRDGSLHSPFQPQVITSTVGQIGSRLLFRGYGVGRSSLPSSTGLAAADTTICLDEAHLAVPFRETVDAIQGRREEEPLRVPKLHLVTLTATPPEGYDPDDAVDIGGADQRQLGSRWSGIKAVELRESDGKAERELVTATEELVGDGAHVVACIANRVLTARNVHKSLHRNLGDEAEVLLLIGPQRPADRAEQLQRARGPLLEGERPERPLIVVATQTIEVGLDADFDGMVTQSASASALVQRLGRLNRSGQRPGRCIVVRDTDSPLYAQDEPEAWRWLGERAGAPAAIDASVRALAEGTRPPADRSQPLAATLTDAIVTQLAQTSSRPAQPADPDVDPLLSGIGARSQGDVRIVWRCDLRFDRDAEGEEGPEVAAYREALLQLVPPQAWESLTLSVGAAKSFLRALIAESGKLGPATRSDADVEGGGRVPDEAFLGPDRAPFMVVRGGEVLRGAPRPSDEGGAVPLARIAAGDVLVVPTELGGIDRFGLAPSRSGEAADVHPDLPSELAAGPSPEGGPTPIRLSWETLWERVPKRADDHERKLRERAARRRWSRFARRLDAAVRQEGEVTGASGQTLPASTRTLPAEEVIRLFLSQDFPSELVDVRERLSSSEHHWRLRRVDPLPLQGDDGQPRATEDAAQKWAWALQPRQPARDDETAERSAPPTVEEHCAAVRARVAGYAERLGLPEPERQALELAALAHDLGKLDPRFQDFFAGGSRGAGTPSMAKSRFGEGNPAASRLARQRSGLPYGFRHEADSVAIVDAALATGTIPLDLSAADRSLTTFLTGTHHGHGRPLWPLERNGKRAEEFAVDLLGIRGAAAGKNADGWLSGRWMQLFFDLQERYGAWALAYLEALLALADRTISSEGG